VLSPLRRISLIHPKMSTNGAFQVLQGTTCPMCNRSDNGAAQARQSEAEEENQTGAYNMEATGLQSRSA
jgi:hypothetical protein